MPSVRVAVGVVVSVGGGGGDVFSAQVQYIAAFVESQHFIFQLLNLYVQRYMKSLFWTWWLLFPVEKDKGCTRKTLDTTSRHW
jgi:hypothetical protein